MATALSRKQRLRTLEKEIRKGMEEFYYVGIRLREIKDDGLYREAGFSSFKEYCSKRWELRESYVYDLISSAEYREEIPDSASGGVDWTERSVRELKRIPDKKQAARVAAKVVKEVQKSQEQAKRDPTVKPLTLSSTTVRRFVDADLDVKPKAKSKPAPSANGIDLASYLRNKAGQIEGMIENLTEVPAGAWTLLEDEQPELITRLITACDDLADLLRS